jgi:hypothetical protein
MSLRDSLKTRPKQGRVKKPRERSAIAYQPSRLLDSFGRWWTQRPRPATRGHSVDCTTARPTSP